MTRELQSVMRETADATASCPEPQKTSMEARSRSSTKSQLQDERRHISYQNQLQGKWHCSGWNRAMARKEMKRVNGIGS